MSDVVQHPGDVLQQMRFQFSSTLGHPEWERLGDLEFARALYVEVRDLQERCGRAEGMIERARAALDPEPPAPLDGAGVVTRRTCASGRRVDATSRRGPSS